MISNKDKKRKHKTAHRLVAECFIPNPDNLPEVNHKDLNPSNNHKDNLEWVTHKQNQQHASREDRWKAIKDKDAETIRERYKQGEKQADIAKDYGVHQVTISKVIRERGKSLSKRSRLTDDQISVLRDKSLSGVSTSDLAKEYGISWQSANKLVKNQRRYNAEYAKKLSQ